MRDIRLLEVTETVDAPPEKVFALLTDPSRHPEIDGSGMLAEFVSGCSPISGIGDTFVMAMHQEATGDYRVRNEVLDYQPNRRIIWAPVLEPPGALRHVLGDLDLSGYCWIWELEPTASGGTRITHTYDWTGVRDPRARRVFPLVTEEQMAETLHRVAAATR